MKNWFCAGLLAFSLSGQAQAQRTLTDDETDVRYRVETYAPANFPVGMVFAPDGSLFYNEKITGNVRRIAPDGVTQRTPVISLPTNALQERGMLGITLDPAFEDNSLIYVMHTREGTARDYPANTLVRFRYEAGRGHDLETLWSVPITTGQLLHNGGNVHFDAQGYLFVSLGDYGEAAYAQDTSTPQGGIHRFIVTDEGLQPAPGNPFGDDNSLYAYGLRNPFDFTFDPLGGRLFVSEVGPSCDDEINLILPGFNYGWGPDYQCVGLDLIPGLPLYARPLLSFTPVEAPTGIVFYDHPAIPAWQGDLFFCNWNFGDLRRVVLDETRTRVEAVYDINLGGVMCRIDLVVGPDGALYFGTVGEGGGAIMRLVPLNDASE